MKITGEMLIGASAVRGSDATLRAFDPARNADLEPVFGGGGAEEVGARVRTGGSRVRRLSASRRSKPARNSSKRSPTTSSRSAIR